jgi:hypothetical protein
MIDKNSLSDLREELCNLYLTGRWRLVTAYSAFILAGLVGGCAHQQKFGDAVYREPYGPQLGLTTSSLSFPSVRLDEAAETTIRVRGLSVTTYPEFLKILISPSENLEGMVDQPWRSCRFSVTLRSAADGKIIHQQGYDLRDYVPKGSRNYRSAMDEYVSLSLGAIDAKGRWVRDSEISALDYDIVVNVENPSMRKGDRLEIGSAFGPPMPSRD